MKNKTVQTVLEYEKGKLICGISSLNQLYIVNYLLKEEGKLCETPGPVLSMKSFSDITGEPSKLLLVRLTEWICILNIGTGFLVKILRIPFYFNEMLPTNQYLAFVPNTDTHDYDFVTIWGSCAQKVAKFRIDRGVVARLRDFDPNQ